MVAAEVAQSAFELGVFIALGLDSARALGLGVPILERLLRRESIHEQLRSILTPALLVGMVVAAAEIVPELPAFHPNRAAANISAEAAAIQPTSPRLMEKLEATSAPVHPATRILESLASAVSAEENARRFLVSGIAWLLWKCGRSQAKMRRRNLVRLR